MNLAGVGAGSAELALRFYGRVSVPGPFPFSSSLIFSSLPLSDTQDYQPYIRALQGIATHFWPFPHPLSSEFGTYETRACLSRYPILAAELFVDI